MRIERLSPAHEADYERLNRCQDGLIYGSLAYRAFLKSILPDAEDTYLLAFEGDRLAGALPCFIARKPQGAIINSLPFYGSHGGVLFAPNSDEDATARALLDALDGLARAEQALSVTLISNPLHANSTLHSNYFGAQFTDDRIGQFTPLPAGANAEEIMQACHSKTRNMIRKGQKSGFVIRHDGSEEALRHLWKLHQENMSAIDGIAKPWEVFAAIRTNFVYDRDYRVLVAEKDGTVAAALLVFFYNLTAEYFTPASLAAYRSEQPLSLLIFEAMQDAAHRGCTRWNWGGTWPTQHGVYLFKSRWGTQDIPYRYFIREYPEHGSLRHRARTDLLRDYQYFYTIPFSVLEGA